MDEQEIELIEDSLTSIKEAGTKAGTTVLLAYNTLKVAHHKLKVELDDLAKTELRSKPVLRHWLKSRGLPLHSNFEEFFQTFLEEHKKEYRLDISSRSILLNKDGSKLFGFEREDIRITLQEILEKLPLLYM